ETHRWSPGPPLPMALQVSAAVGLDDGRIYSFGGFVPGQGVQSATFELTPAPPTASGAAAVAGSWARRAAMTTARDQAPAVVVGGIASVLGGSIHCHCQALGVNDQYTPPSNQASSADLSADLQGGPLSACRPVHYRLTVANNGPDP